MPNPLEPYEKRLNPLKKQLVGFTATEITYKLNDLKSFGARFKAVYDDLVESIAEAKQAGAKGTAAKDFAHDKEVRGPFAALKLTHENITEGLDELTRVGHEAPRIYKLLIPLRLELARFNGAPKDVKIAKDLIKQIDGMLDSIELARKFPGSFPKDAVDISKKKLDDYLTDAMKDVAKVPPKEVKPLPAEFNKVNFARLQKQVNQWARDLKEAPDKLDDLLKESGGATGDRSRSLKQTPADFVDDLKIVAEEVTEKAESLRKVQKDYRMALRTVPYASEFPKLEEQLRRLSIAYKATAKKLEKEAKTA